MTHVYTSFHRLSHFIVHHIEYICFFLPENMCAVVVGSWLQFNHIISLPFRHCDALLSETNKALKQLSTMKQ